MVACAKLRGSVAGLGRGGVCVYQEEPERSNAVTWRFEGDFGAVLQECALGDFWALE